MGYVALEVLYFTSLYYFLAVKIQKLKSNMHPEFITINLPNNLQHLYKSGTVLYISIQTETNLNTCTTNDTAYRMHVKHINIEIVSCDAQTFKHLQMTYKNKRMLENCSTNSCK